MGISGATVLIIFQSFVTLATKSASEAYQKRFPSDPNKKGFIKKMMDRFNSAKDKYEETTETVTKVVESTKAAADDFNPPDIPAV